MYMEYCTHLLAAFAICIGENDLLCFCDHPLSSKKNKNKIQCIRVWGGGDVFETFYSELTSGPLLDPKYFVPFATVKFAPHSASCSIATTQKILLKRNRIRQPFKSKEDSVSFQVRILFCLFTTWNAFRVSARAQDKSSEYVSDFPHSHTSIVCSKNISHVRGNPHL